MHHLWRELRYYTTHPIYAQLFERRLLSVYLHAFLDQLNIARCSAQLYLKPFVWPLPAANQLLLQSILITKEMNSFIYLKYICGMLYNLLNNLQTMMCWSVQIFSMKRPEVIRWHKHRTSPYSSIFVDTKSLSRLSNTAKETIYPDASSIQLYVWFLAVCPGLSAWASPSSVRGPVRPERIAFWKIYIVMYMGI